MSGVKGGGSGGSFGRVGLRTVVVVVVLGEWG